MANNEEQTVMNISKASMGNTCGERCAFAFQFDLSSHCNAYNNGTSIGLSYDAGSISPILFNNNKYNLYPPSESIALVFPSYHTYDGSKTTGELIISTQCPNNGTLLYICVPMSTQSGTSNPLLNEIFDSIIKAPLTQNNPEINLNLTNYTLNSILPKKPYFFYESLNNETNIVSNCIAFGLQDGIALTSDYASQLTALVSPLPADFLFIPPNENRYLFYNPDGPMKMNNGIGDQIYIDCSPTGNSVETEDVTFTKGTPQPNMDLLETLTTDGVIYALMFVLFVGVLFLLNMFFSKITGPSAPVKKG
jgi:hypothetical protein